MIKVVNISAFAQKQLRRIPLHVVDKLYLWKRSVEEIGWEQVRKVPGYHDEMLVGDRRGQRSIRLSRAYRAIYKRETNGDITFIAVLEVNKHEY
jgi:proteic killer suppression protein